LLTHPSSTDALVRKVFGDLHMLSHLVGAANRADIRRLHQLEEEKAALEEKLIRQQRMLHDGLTSRDAKIHALTAQLSARIERQFAAEAGNVAATPGLEPLVADLRRRLDTEVRRRERAERRAEELGSARAGADRTRQFLEQQL